MCLWQLIELILILDLFHSNASSWVIHLVSASLAVIVPRYTKHPLHTHTHMHTNTQINHWESFSSINEWQMMKEVSRFLKTHTQTRVSQVTGGCVKLPYLPTEADKGCSCSERGWWLSATDALTLIQTETPRTICQSRSTPWFPWNAMMALLNIGRNIEGLWCHKK